MRFYLFESYNKQPRIPLRVLRHIPTEYDNEWKQARVVDHLIKKGAQSPDHLLFMSEVLGDLKNKLKNKDKKNGDYLKLIPKDKDGNIVDDRNEEELKRIAEIGENFYIKKEVEKEESVKNETELF